MVLCDIKEGIQAGKQKGGSSVVFGMDGQVELEGMIEAVAGSAVQGAVGTSRNQSFEDQDARRHILASFARHLGVAFWNTYSNKRMPTYTLRGLAAARSAEGGRDKVIDYVGGPL